jgi:hypothetical protein
LGHADTLQGRCELLYDLPGHIRQHADTVLIRFTPLEEYAHRAELPSLLSILNAALFKDPSGRQILFFAQT